LKIEDSRLKPGAAWGHAACSGSCQLPEPSCQNRFGAAMSSSPWEWLRNGDEDVATPFHAGAGGRSLKIEDSRLKAAAA
jgi:hypothetical protein